MKIDVTASIQQTKKIKDFEMFKPMASVTLRDIEISDSGKEKKEGDISRIIENQSEYLFAEVREVIKKQLERGEVKG